MDHESYLKGAQELRDYLQGVLGAAAPASSSSAPAAESSPQADEVPPAATEIVPDDHKGSNLGQRPGPLPGT